MADDHNLELNNDESKPHTLNNNSNIVYSKQTTTKPEFYGKAQKYWSEVPATVNGMLGGLGYISAIDIQGSSNYLREFKQLGKGRALDCGAGIGRVTKNLLMPRFACVDMVEQDTAFAGKARDYCLGTEDSNSTYLPNRIGTIYNMGLQEFTPEPEKYDLIWTQWVLGHLTDADLLQFFIRIRSGLSKNGLFVLKENVTSSKEVEKDEADSSLTRPLKLYEAIIKQAGYRIVKMTRQKGFPNGLYPVYMIACRPTQQ